jgi:drug/metabolite transporter (DMT)-like permease
MRHTALRRREDTPTKVTGVVNLRPRLPSRKSEMDRLGEPPREPVLTPRFVLAVALIVLGIAWIAYYYVVVRVDPTVFPAPKAGGPKFLDKLDGWNYVIGFGLFFLGLMISANPATPLGRGRGVVVGMLGCFLIGLAWICTYYVISDDVSRLPIFDDLANYNLVVGIGFMAVGFTFATRWE